MFLTVFVLGQLRILTLKTEGQRKYRKPHCKVTKLKIKLPAHSGLGKSGFETSAGQGASLLGLYKSTGCFKSSWTF